MPKDYVRELERAAGLERHAADSIRNLAEQLPDYEHYKQLRAGLENAASGLEINAGSIAEFIKEPDRSKIVNLLRWSGMAVGTALTVISLASVEGAASGAAEALTQAELESLAASECVAGVGALVAGDLGVSPRFDEITRDPAVEEAMRPFTNHVKRLEQLLYLVKDLSRRQTTTTTLLELSSLTESAYLQSIDDFYVIQAEHLEQRAEFRSGLAEELAASSMEDELRGL